MEPRSICYRCLRPTSVCHCDLITRLPTATRVLLLQHPRERHVGVGTARLAHLSLPNSELRIGVDFSSDPVVREAADGGAYLLFPGERAINVRELRPGKPITLIAVDGTWNQAKSLWRRNPILGALPQLRFTPPRPSDYRIRREPADHCLATIEALAYVLEALEDGSFSAAKMLAPFLAMVEEQLRFAANQQNPRQGRSLRRPRAQRAPIVPAVFRDEPERIVCVHGEVNVWERRRDGNEVELVHWLMSRPHTGERFEAVIAPRHSIAPSTYEYTGLSKTDLEGGLEWPDFMRALGGFLRPNDLACAWRTYPIDILARGGTELRSTLDLRRLASTILARSAGDAETCATRLGMVVPPPWGRGRGGKRIAAIDAVARYFLGTTARED